MLLDLPPPRPDKCGENINEVGPESPVNERDENEIRTMLTKRILQQNNVIFLWSTHLVGEVPLPPLLSNVLAVFPFGSILVVVVAAVDIGRIKFVCLDSKKLA